MKSSSRNNMGGRDGVTMTRYVCKNGHELVRYNMVEDSDEGPTTKCGYCHERVKLTKLPPEQQYPYNRKEARGRFRRPEQKTKALTVGTR